MKPPFAVFHTCPPCTHPRSEDETELEKAAAEWGKKHRPKKQAGRGDTFKPKQNVRRGRGRKR